MQLKENVTYTLTRGVIDTVTVKQATNGEVVVASRFITEEQQWVSSYAYGGLRIGATYYFLETHARRLNVTLAGGANLLIKGTTKQYSNGTWTVNRNSTFNRSRRMPGWTVARRSSGEVERI